MEELQTMQKNKNLLNRVARELVNNDGHAKARKKALHLLSLDMLNTDDYLYLLNKIDQFSGASTLVELNANDIYTILTGLYILRNKCNNTDLSQLVHHIERALCFALGEYDNE